jgi:hypothetical protein
MTTPQGAGLAECRTGLAGWQARVPGPHPDSWRTGDPKRQVTTGDRKMSEVETIIGLG